MPTSIGGNRINFHYNFGDYNNGLKTLSHKPKPHTPLVLSQINREHPIVFRQELQNTLTSYLWCTHREKVLSFFCYLT